MPLVCSPDLSRLLQRVTEPISVTDVAPRPAILVTPDLARGSWGLHLVLATLVRPFASCQCFHLCKPALLGEVSRTETGVDLWCQRSRQCIRQCICKMFVAVCCCFSDKHVWMLLIPTCVSLLFIFNTQAVRLPLSLTFLSCERINPTAPILVVPHR